MTNFEAYKDDLMEIDGDIAFDKTQRRVVECFSKSSCKCEDCEFNEKCKESDKIKWLYEEYEPPILSDDELELLKALEKATNKKYKYLARNSGRITCFTNKPFIHCGPSVYSYTSGNYFADISCNDGELFKNIENKSGVYDIENKIFLAYESENR